MAVQNGSPAELLRPVLINKQPIRAHYAQKGQIATLALRRPPGNPDVKTGMELSRISHPPPARIL